jgi:hypothetical protein
MLDMELNSPNAFNNHITTAITTTAFRIDLILWSIGIYLLTNHKRTPTTISTNKTLIKGIFYLLPPWFI